MIAYKWVIKKDNKYYSLMSYGIDSWIREKPNIYYELGRTYNSFKDLKSRSIREMEFCSRYPNKCEGNSGYHFWKTPYLESQEWRRYNNYLKKYSKLDTGINAVLKCEILETKIEEPHRCIAKKFKVLEEIKL